MTGEFGPSARLTTWSNLPTQPAIRRHWRSLTSGRLVADCQLRYRSDYYAAGAIAATARARNIWNRRISRHSFNVMGRIDSRDAPTQPPRMVVQCPAVLRLRPQAWPRQVRLSPTCRQEAKI